MKCLKKRKLIKRINSRIYEIRDLISQRNEVTLYSYEKIMADWVIENVKSEMSNLIKRKNRINNLR